MDRDYSLADISAATGQGRGWDDNNEIWILMLFFLFGFGGYGGFGGQHGAPATSADVQRGFDTTGIVNKLNGIDGGLCNGFYAMNTGMLNGFHSVDNELCQGFATANQAITQARFDNQQCCCETNRNIDSVRYEAAKNTCDIVNAGHADTQRILDAMSQTSMQALRDKIADKDRDLQSAKFQLSQQNQNAYLVNQLKPCPIPAYQVANPYCGGCNPCCA